MIRAALLLPAMLTAAAHAQGPRADGHVTFDRPDAPYTTDLARADFGSGSIDPNRGFAAIVDRALRITYNPGVKVNGTGLSLVPALPPADQYTLQFRIRYAQDFETGLHGKQVGLGGGRNYTGGQGQPARDNGDGWSIRIQFDSNDKTITNQLYVYHSQMPGTYGDSLGTRDLRYHLTRGQWHTLRLTVTMQTSADAADGRIELWRDNEKQFDVAGIRLVTQEAGRNINTLRLEMFTGGGGAFPSRHNHVDLDDIRWTPGRMD